MIVFVSINAFDCIVFLKVVLVEQIENLSVNRDLRQTNEYTSSDLRKVDLIEPWVFPYVSCLEPLFRISVEDICDQISTIR
jgi:hypothetical protein